MFRLGCSRNYLPNQVFVGIADHPCDSVELGDFIGSALGVASSDKDFRFGLPEADASYGSTRVMIGGCGDCAGVENNDVCFVWNLDAMQATNRELAFNG